MPLVPINTFLEKTEDNLSFFFSNNNISGESITLIRNNLSQKQKKHSSSSDCLRREDGSLSMFKQLGEIGTNSFREFISCASPTVSPMKIKTEDPTGSYSHYTDQIVHIAGGLNAEM